MDTRMRIATHVGRAILFSKSKLSVAEYAKFEAYLQKYDESLSSTPTKPGAVVARKKVRRAIDEVADRVTELKNAVSTPLFCVLTLFSLQVMCVQFPPT